MALDGDPNAQNALGILFGTEGFRYMNLEDKEYWYLQAANQNFPKAQYNLALFYGREESSLEEGYKSMVWGRVAALNGYPNALKLLRLEMEHEALRVYHEETLEDAKEWLRVNHSITDFPNLEF